MQGVIEDLVPLATVLTPNIHEAEAMLNSEIKTLEDMKRAVSRIREMFFFPAIAEEFKMVFS